MTRIIVQSCWLLILVSWSSCSFFDNESIQPAFLDLKNPTLTTNIDQGAPSHGIQDAWVFVDGEIIGVFPLPARVPIIPSGFEQEIRIVAGVKENGSLSGSKEYPFYEPITRIVDISPGEEISIPLDFRYIDEAVFDFVDGFEGTTIFDFDVDANNNTELQISNDEARFGSFSGKMVVTSENSTLEVSSTQGLPNTRNLGGSVFLEFDYLSNETVLAGTFLESINNDRLPIYEVAYRPTTEWKRAYVNVTSLISNDQILVYRILFAVGYENGGNQEGVCYLDNVRLVHF